VRFTIGQPIQVQKPLARLIHSLLLIPLVYRFEQLGLAGLHSGIGPSSALSIGVAIATYVQAKPTIRINILTARFMVFSLRCETPGRKPRGGGIIQKRNRASSLFSRSWRAFPAMGASEIRLRLNTSGAPALVQTQVALKMVLDRASSSSTR
jgi:hypothetical protein